MSTETELLYFKEIDVLINYDKTSHGFTSHRIVDDAELKRIKAYLTVTFKFNIDVFTYLGVDSLLEHDYNRYKKSNKFNKEKEIDTAVKEVISKGLSDYYFYAISDKLQEIKDYYQSDELRDQLQQLVDAYNIHVEDKRKISIEDLL